MATSNDLTEIATFVDLGIAKTYITTNSGLRANILVEYNQQAPKVWSALSRHTAFLSLIAEDYTRIDQFFLEFRTELRAMGGAIEKLMLVREAKIRHLLPFEPFDMDVELAILSAAHDEWTRARVEYVEAQQRGKAIDAWQCQGQHVSGLSCSLKRHAAEMDDMCTAKLPSGHWAEWLSFGGTSGPVVKVVGMGKKMVRWRVGEFGTNEASTKALLDAAFDRYEFSKQRMDAAIAGESIPTHHVLSSVVDIPGEST